MTLYIVFGCCAVFLILLSLALAFDARNLRKRVFALEFKNLSEEHAKEEMIKQFATVNKNYAIIEQIITPFIEWVDSVKKQQQADVKYAAEHAEKLSRPLQRPPQ